MLFSILLYYACILHANTNYKLTTDKLSFVFPLLFCVYVYYVLYTVFPCDARDFSFLQKHLCSCFLFSYHFSSAKCVTNCTLILIIHKRINITPPKIINREQKQNRSEKEQKNWFFNTFAENTKNMRY